MPAFHAGAARTAVETQGASVSVVADIGLLSPVVFSLLGRTLWSERGVYRHRNPMTPIQFGRVTAKECGMADRIEFHQDLSTGFVCRKG